jgi:hypothetical protein
MSENLISIFDYFQVQDMIDEEFDTIVQYLHEDLQKKAEKDEIIALYLIVSIEEKKENLIFYLLNLKKWDYTHILEILKKVGLHIINKENEKYYEKCMTKYEKLNLL